jgi:hypothetical protein
MAGPAGVGFFSSVGEKEAAVISKIIRLIADVLQACERM